jgi:hypothetical protein
MKIKLFMSVLFMLLFVACAIAQPPPRGQGRPGGPPPPHGVGPGMPGPDRPGGQAPGEWIRPHDENQNGNLEADEFRAAIQRTFAELDKNGNGSLEAEELIRTPRPPRPDGERPPLPRDMQDPTQNFPRLDQGKRILPPFFYMDHVEGLTKAGFEGIVRGVFNAMDDNSDGILNKDEARRTPKGQGAPRPGVPSGPRTQPPPPNARFIGAELRFGDKLVSGQPFSAETVIEDTRRLFDGTTVKKELRGAIYRDGAGRTRREQPLDMVGGVQISGTGAKRVTLVFINDFPGKAQYSLDLDNKIARKSPIWNDRFPFPDTDGPNDAKTESLGTKTLEGVNVNGTRTTFEIPVGHLGNDKPIQVVHEKWFSPELQVVVMSRNVDPIAGEHIFKLVNVRRSEPAGDLFAVPAGYRVENVLNERSPGK